ncbi:hypothetical protein SKAU_G00314720 [Synaphobranchus kaupii]|uniref:Uncharacterized protein n=1 Tax=Synaphobranchus kaupii TaxID=118154 RepID=A0A9Q1ILE7_SYNKA|nr:hypothetical protein SKAU_G00314720 [Synaphobranchus kaupii]
MPGMSARTWDPIPQTAAARRLSQQKDPGFKGKHRRGTGERKKRDSFLQKKKARRARKQKKETLKTEDLN